MHRLVVLVHFVVTLLVLLFPRFRKERGGAVFEIERGGAILGGLLFLANISFLGFDLWQNVGLVFAFLAKKTYTSFGGEPRRKSSWFMPVSGSKAIAPVSPLRPQH